MKEESLRTLPLTQLQSEKGLWVGAKEDEGERSTTRRAVEATSFSLVPKIETCRAQSAQNMISALVWEATSEKNCLRDPP